MNIGLELVRKEWKLDADQTAIGLIARLEFPKGHETLFQAIPIVLKRFSRAKFFIIGGDHLSGQPTFNRYHKMIQDLGISESCFLLGFKNDIPKLIQGLDIVALPSWWEGHPLAILEAMAAEKPVIASNVGGTPEIIDHGKNGLLVPPRDPEALAEAICRLIENPEWSKELTSQAYEKVCGKFDQKNMIDQILSIYNQSSFQTSYVPAYFA